MTKRKETSDSEIVLRGKKYYYRGTPPGVGKQVEVSLKTKSFQEAKHRKLALIEKLSRIGVSEKTATFSLLFQNYKKDRLELHEAKELSAASVQEDSYIGKHLEVFFGPTRVDKIDQDLFDTYVKSKKSKIHDFTNHRKVLTCFLNWCRKKKHIRFTSSFEIPKWVPRERKPLTEDEIKSLLFHSGGSIRVYIAMYLFMGMRSQEITRLRWSQINFSERYLVLESADTKTRKKRVIPINSTVLDLLEQRKGFSDTPWVFPRRKGKDPNRPHMDRSGFVEEWHALLTTAGIRRKIQPHDLRATWQLYAHLNPNFTDTQKEKMAGSAINVQKNIYVKMEADHLRGLEEVVNIQGLDELLKKERLGQKPRENMKWKSKKSET